MADDSMAPKLRSLVHGRDGSGNAIGQFTAVLWSGAWNAPNDSLKTGGRNFIVFIRAMTCRLPMPKILGSDGHHGKARARQRNLQRRATLNAEHA